MKLLVVNYHYIRSNKTGNGIYPLSLDEFERQVDQISKEYSFISVNELLKYQLEKRYNDKCYCLLTFDDGLKEQMDAFDLLCKKGVPALFNVITEPIKKKYVVNIHKIHNVRAVVADRDLFYEIDKTYNISNYLFDQDLLSVKYKYDNEMAQKVKYFLSFVLKEDECTRLIDNLFKEVCGDESIFAKDFYMHPEDLTKLSDQGMLGTHSSSHLPLGMQEPDIIFQDIRESVNYLEELTKSKISSISYPYGVGSAISDQLYSASLQAGLKLGFTVERGMNEINTPGFNFMKIQRINTNDVSKYL